MKRVKEQGFKSVILQDLNYAKIDEIDEIAKIELRLERLGISKIQIIFLKSQLFQRGIYILSYKRENRNVFKR